VPPTPEKVYPITDELLDNWRKIYHDLQQSKDKNFIIEEITKFHYKFLSIHPFLDGNGRIARFLLNQQASELLDSRNQITIEDKPPYFQALSKAQTGDIQPLKLIITQAIFGTEEIK